jgi:hypothetical protein
LIKFHFKVVGTKRNKIQDSLSKNEIVKQRFDAIKEFISDKIYANQIVEPYFAINTFDIEPKKKTSLFDETEIDAEKRSDDIEALRRVIELISLNEPYMGEQLPIKWMEFEKSLEKLKNKGLFYASLSQVFFFFFLIKKICFLILFFHKFDIDLRDCARERNQRSRGVNYLLEFLS